MQIQFNTDHNISNGGKLSEPLTQLIREELDQFGEHITRIEVHLSDVDGDKNGQDDKRCMLEARLKGLQPIAVTNFANTHHEAVEGSIDKMKTSLNTLIGRLNNH